MERSEKVSLEKASAEGLMGTEPEISVSRAGGEFRRKNSLNFAWEAGRKSPLTGSQ